MDVTRLAQAAVIGAVAVPTAIGAAKLYGAGHDAGEAEARERGFDSGSIAESFVGKGGIAGLGLGSMLGIAAGGSLAVFGATVGRLGAVAGGSAILGAGIVGLAHQMGRTAGFDEGAKDPSFVASREKFFATREAKRDAEQLDWTRDRLREEHGDAFDAARDGVVVERLAERVIGTFDHDGDGQVDLRDGQHMRMDERAAADRHLGAGDGGPVQDKDDSAVSLLSYFNAIDKDDDGFASLDEVTDALGRMDPNGDGVVTVTEAEDGAYIAAPKPQDIGDYEDL